MRLLIAALLLTACAPKLSQAQPAETPEARADRILTEVPLADGHNDWPWALRLAHGVEGAMKADLTQPAVVPSTSSFATSAVPSRGHTTIPLIRKGKLGIQLWSVYVPATLSPDDAVKQTFEQIAIARSFPARHPETFTLVTTADAAEAAWKDGRVASFLALEGAHQVNDDIAILRRAHAQGVRSMTLAHSRNTTLFDSATDKPKFNGMAPAAAAMIAEMNRLGILVDLSHVSPAVMHQVLDVTRAPVIFTHSSAKGVTNHPRNVPDDVLKRLRKNGGVVMVTFVPSFVDQARTDWQLRRDAHVLVAGKDAAAAERMAEWDRANPRPVSTLAMVADHVDHVAEVAGHDHVGIGGDYDGIPDLPKGLENVGTYPALFAELARRGWTDKNLRKLAGKNFLRALRATEKVAG